MASRSDEVGVLFTGLSLVDEALIVANREVLGHGQRLS